MVNGGVGHYGPQVLMKFFPNLADEGIPIVRGRSLGQPEPADPLGTKASQQFWAVASGKGIASTYLVVRSIIDNRYFIPQESGRGPIISSMMSPKRRACTGLWSSVG